MVKVLIVDDEILIRVGIKSCINWEANGFTIVGLAEDGKEALDIIERQEPDIVLTDIKMPNIDGLELIEKIRKSHPQIRIIVLSCYNELDFIKKAMKSGADDYILKLSMQPEDLLRVLNSTKSEIEKRKNPLLQISGSGEIKNKNFMKEELYKRAIDNSLGGKQLIEELKKLGSEMSFLQSGIICASIDDYSKASSISRMEDQYLLKFAVLNIMEEILSACCKGDIVEIRKGEFLIIFDYREAADSYQSVLKEFCQRANNALKNYLNISASFGISGLWKDAVNFKIRYGQAKKALEMKFYFGKECILFYNENDVEFSDRMVLLDFEKEKLLVNHLENLCNEGAKAIINGFFRSIQELKEYHPSKVRRAAVEILHAFILVAKKFEVENELEAITSLSGENPVDMLMKAETLDNIREWFEETIERFMNCLLSKRQCAERPEILKLKQYISARVYEDITLEQASRVTNMSRSYLSSIFRKETGETFTDYVNRRKMEEAKELIQRYGLKTREAAERLGFNDESYFSKLFKKYLGVNPSRVGR